MSGLPPAWPTETSSGAVLLSYSPPDAQAAQKIGDALHSAGAEVWLDLSGERRGGGGDAEVTRRIRACRLFLPVISKHTQEGREGSFRREWKAADERARTLGKGRPFLVPVSIDATDDCSAVVPDSFLGVPWTRLPGGETPPAFCEQVKRLLAGTGPAFAGTGTVTAAPRIPDYELLRLIGRGSYGDVWLVRGVTGIYRAIKIVWRERFSDAGPFEREFRGLKEFAAISLRESVQLALLHVGRNEEAGFFYYVMELADDAERGAEIDPTRYVPLTLKELRRRRDRLPPDECVTIGVELARELAGLHAHGLVHRDIKPSNVILVGGVAKLADIGLVTAAGDARTFVGTEGFVPPEGPGSPAADVFALGRLLYELSTGLDRQQFPQLPPNLDRMPDHRELLKLNDVILRACDPRAEQRYRDGQALLADLLRLQAGRPVRRPAPRLGILLGAAATVLALGVAGVWLRSRAARITPTGHPGEAVTVPLPVPVEPALEKSLVVLPLEDLSAETESDLFTDGLHAEIIATLGRIADLKVIGRWTALGFKDRKATLAEIGTELRVGHVISGTVRRAGDIMRIQLELRRASDEALLWTKAYSKEPKDVLAIQSDIANEVGRVLRARITSGDDSARMMTTNPQAFEFYLKGVAFWHTYGTNRMRTITQSVEYLEQALHLDPSFMPAAEKLSITDTILSKFVADPEESARRLADAKRWADRAAELVPGGAGNGGLAWYYTEIEHDGARALPLAEKLVQARPNETVGYDRVGEALILMGRVSEGLAWRRRGIALDPSDLMMRIQELWNLSLLRRRDEWDRVYAHYRAIANEAARNRLMIADSRYILTGEVVLEGIPELTPKERLGWVWRERRFAEYLAMVDERMAVPGLADGARLGLLERRRQALLRLNRLQEAEETTGAALALIEKMKATSEGAGLRDLQLRAAKLKGQFDEPIAAALRDLEAIRVPARQYDAWVAEYALAKLYAEAGQNRESIALLAKLLRVPIGLSAASMRVDPDWDPLRGDPQFEALLNDPKNNEPL